MSTYLWPYNVLPNLFFLFPLFMKSGSDTNLRYVHSTFWYMSLNRANLEIPQYLSNTIPLQLTVLVIFLRPSQNRWTLMCEVSVMQFQKQRNILIWNWVFLWKALLTIPVASGLPLSQAQGYQDKCTNSNLISGLNLFWAHVTLLCI